MNELNGRKFLNEVHFGEEPSQFFLNSFESPKVELIDFAENSYEMMYRFILGSFSNKPNQENIYSFDKKEIEEVVEACLKGEALPLALEIPTFLFRISGIDRVITHQLVRSRIGVVFSQHCTGDNDVRNVDYLLPGSFDSIRSKKFQEKVIKWLKEGKEIYSEMIDEYEISIQDARHFLPHCISTHIQMHCNYMMLRNFVARRLCANETVQMQSIAKQIKDRVTEEFPLLGKYLNGACDIAKRCLFKKNNSIFGGSVFFPCGKYPHLDSEETEITIDEKAYVHRGPARMYRKFKSEAERKD